MQTNAVTVETLRSSVIAVPPLARDQQDKIDSAENAKIVRHIESGGVRTFLYGGNANLYHLRPSEYAELLAMLEAIAGEQSLMIPSVGPAYGMMMDQAAALRETDFPTAMVLPQTAVMTEAGLMTGFRRFVEAFGQPAVLYIKDEGYISPTGAATLVNDGLVSFVKYAIVRDDPTIDPFLSELLSTVDPNIVVSGMGEQPAITHFVDFGLAGFTSGCVCVAPSLAQQMLTALQANDIAMAEQIRQTFQPLENLRNNIHPIRVLHEAVELAGIATTGPHIPLLSSVTGERRAEIRTAACELLPL